MKVYALGTAGWIPGKNETSCFMVETENALFLLDAGTGIANLMHYKDVLDRYPTIHLLLSHYHLDHTIGLIYLDPLVRNKELIIYGPGLPYYKYSTEYYMRSLLRPEFFSRRIEDFATKVTCKDYPTSVFSLSGSTVSVKEQTHSSPSFRISIDNKLVYATDTAFNASDWANVKADVLLHECWEVENTNAKHTSLAKLMQELPQDAFSQILLIHQNPFWSSDVRASIEEIIRDTKFSLPCDGMTLMI